MALIHLDFFSNVLGKCVKADVILPQSTTGQIGLEGQAEAEFPTLYLLHGMSDDETIWQRRTSVERYATYKGCAVVMPCGDLSWYTDMECGYQRYYTYIAKELPQICRSFFRGMSAKRELNWIAGLSMGGYGALKIGLNESDSFSGVICLSGAYTVEGRPYAPYWNAIFGEGEARVKHTIPYAVNRLEEEKRPKPKIYMACGTEDGLLEDSRKTRDLLVLHGYDITYAEAPGGHTWEFWDSQIVFGLDKLCE
ncbi:MAG: esterase family protein [Clostridia bacterium]|nr:esterase family protein [Clostridia bacterium]